MRKDSGHATTSYSPSKSSDESIDDYLLKPSKMPNFASILKKKRPRKDKETRKQTNEEVKVVVEVQSRS